jgi:hypothetical protein
VVLLLVLGVIVRLERLSVAADDVCVVAAGAVGGPVHRPGVAVAGRSPRSLLLVLGVIVRLEDLSMAADDV